jgi:hypothetical protein
VGIRGPIALLAGLLAVALLAVGCGGGGSDSSSASSEPATSSLSKAAFIKKADEVCKKGGERTQSEFAAYIKEEGISAKNEPTQAQFAEVSEGIQVPAFKRQAGELRALGAPAGDEAEVTAFVDAIDEGIEKVEEADPKEALESASPMFAKADKLAAEYGFKVCGKSSSQ